MKRSRFVETLHLLIAPVFMLWLSSTVGQAQDMDFVHPKSPTKPAPFLKPQEALKTFQIHKDFRLELVAADPLIHDPVAIDFDEFGRIWVAELRSYMIDLVDSGKKKALGRIMLLEDTDDDGVMDKATEFLKNLPRPRAIRAVNGGIIYGDSSSLWFVPEKNGKAGKRQLIDKSFNRGGNVEHQPNALYPGFDNWYYISRSNGRKYGFENGKWVVGQAEGRGQWGLSQDDAGRFVWNTNSNKVNCDLLPQNYYTQWLLSSGIRRSVGTSRTVYPIRVTTGLNRGYRLLRTSKDGVYRGVTASCGPCVYRGNQFPKEYYGNYFSCAPETHTVPRCTVEDVGASVRITGAPAPAGHSFLASTDERSRMVNAYSGPDGTLYLVDFYRGVIQDKGYLTQYLKREINRRKLENPIGGGRIYRIVYKGNSLTKWDKLGNMSHAELVPFLTHPNYWHRRTAQRILVQSRDKSVIPAVRKLLSTTKLAQGRIHALWTLRGLDALQVNDLVLASDITQDDLLTHIARLGQQFAGTDQAQVVQTLFAKFHQLKRPRIDLQVALASGAFQKKNESANYKLMKDILAANKGDQTILSAVLYSMSDEAAKQLFQEKLVTEDSLAPQILSRICAANSTGITKLFASTFVDRELSNQFREKLLKAAGQGVVRSRNPKATLWLLSYLQKLPTEEAYGTMISMVSARGRGYRKMNLKRTPRELATLKRSSSKRVASAAERLERDVFRIRSSSTIIDLSYRKSRTYKKAFASGQRHYVTHCMGCHQIDGLGAEKFGPPLVGSEWVTGDPKVAIRIMLNGITGPIEVDGTTYKSPEILPLMPGLRHNEDLTDEKAADLLTYVRNAWGNEAPPVTAQTVARVRQESANEMTPYEAVALNKFRLGRKVDLVARVNPAHIGGRPFEAILAAVKQHKGDPKLGYAIFRKQTCISCHAVGQEVKPFGPDLRDVGQRHKRDALVEAILKPSEKLTKGFETQMVMTKQGKVVAGFVHRESKTEVELRTPQGKAIRVPRKDIQRRAQSAVSAMPQGLVNNLTIEEFASLVAYLESLRKK
ncbi:MAG: c-type cytochrome [Gemmataceae bacterium]